jgi:hypothetical protein
MKGRILGILVLAAWGMFKLPWEARMTANLEARRLGGFKITAGLRQQTGQAGFVAALGGLRAAVADLLWIRAHVAWQDVQYGRMKLLFDACTTMQPRRVMFWDLSSWHMAWNGAGHIMDSVPDKAEQRAKMEAFFKLGEDYLLRGIENNPDSWELYDRLGMLYRDKFHDHEKAAAAYDEGSKRPGRLDYMRRFGVYELSQVPGREREAYDRLLGLFRESENEWLPSLLFHLQRIETRLGIPDEQRIYRDVVKLAATPGKEQSAYTALADLYKTGARQPAVLDAIRALEQKIDIPLQRRIKLPPQNTPPSD